MEFSKKKKKKKGGGGGSRGEVLGRQFNLKSGFIIS